MTTRHDSDLLDRLSTLGDHLDTERASIESTSDLHHGFPRRESRRMVLAASVVIIAGGLLALTQLDRGQTPQPASTPAASASAPATQPSSELPSGAVPSIPTASLPGAVNDATCASGGLTAVLPLVVGMSYDDAARTLEQAGFGAEPTFENSPAGTANGDDPVVNQLTTGHPVPLEPATCGVSIPLTVAFQPGPLHLVQNGETYPSIAEAEGINVDDLLAHNGLTRDELGSQGRTIDSPLMAGQALRLR